MLAQWVTWLLCLPSSFVNLTFIILSRQNLILVQKQCQIWTVQYCFYQHLVHEKPGVTLLLLPSLQPETPPGVYIMPKDQILGPQPKKTLANLGPRPIVCSMNSNVRGTGADEEEVPNRDF